MGYALVRDIRMSCWEMRRGKKEQSLQSNGPIYFFIISILIVVIFSLFVAVY